MTRSKLPPACAQGDRCGVRIESDLLSRGAAESARTAGLSHTGPGTCTTTQFSWIQFLSASVKSSHWRRAREDKNYKQQHERHTHTNKHTHTHSHTQSHTQPYRGPHARADTHTAAFGLGPFFADALVFATLFFCLRLCPPPSHLAAFHAFLRSFSVCFASALFLFVFGLAFPFFLFAVPSATPVLPVVRGYHERRAPQENLIGVQLRS